METTTDEGGERGKRICAATLRFLLLLTIMANEVLAQNTTDPAEGSFIISLYLVYLFSFVFHGCCLQF